MSSLHGVGSGRGQVFHNPVTRERVVVLTDPVENPERALVGHLYVGAGGRVAAPHSHPESTERFHVLGGRVGFTIDGQEQVLGPGECAEVPPGVVHDWWQVGDEETQVLVEVTPGDRFSEVASTLFGLARDGKVNEHGLPDLLQSAVMLHAYRDAIVFSSPPPWLQRLLFGALAPVGRMLGRRPVYPDYLVSTDVVEPSATAMALLDSDGRLKWSSSKGS
ncbi:cupin domain-containing protein [Streptomyces sp. R11]|uniref:Cupin domain-containing protein n=1 Tax=Streptomyces sp. R11 TaxID=3238625 RepID=A0AB39NBI4_9ACTN